MNQGFARIAAASVRVHLGDIEKNEQELLAVMETMQKQGVELLVFPELCLTGYTIGDLLLHGLVQQRALEALLRLAQKTGDMAVVVGLPFWSNGRLFNCAAVLHQGKVRGIVPKTFLPNGNEFYESRWFVSGTQAGGTAIIKGDEVPFAPDLLFSLNGFQFAVEICEDLWAPMPPSSWYALQGADIIVNPSASNAVVGKHDYRRRLLEQQSARLYAGYAFASAGFGESTSDLVFCGYTGVFESGSALAEGARFQESGGTAVADIDITRLRYKRQRSGSYYQKDDCPPMLAVALDNAGASLPETPLLRSLNPLPFVPEGEQADHHLEEIVQIQVTGLKTRLVAIGCKQLVIGVSGGLDSTLALLIAVKAMDELNYPRTNIHALTLPGMGTGSRTKGNADFLMSALAVLASEISIEPAVRQHFADIGQNENTYDVTYENSQARERTQILMDYANKVNGIVLGTGDMSEAALGFCTYNGDHMSMYNVNCGVPKTLVRRLVRYLAERCFDDAVKKVCLDILDTPVSPELLPVSAGELNQRTEEILGDYALNDFFLYHLMDSGSSPARLRLLAAQAFEGVYAPDKIEAQLQTFIRRFFTQQFKRNCVPDGPKVGNIGLSPRGDWRMPSDMGFALWKGDIES